MFDLYLLSNYFHFFIYFFVRNDVMCYTVVCEFEILCEQDRRISLDSQEAHSFRRNPDTELITVLRQ